MEKTLCELLKSIEREIVDDEFFDSEKGAPLEKRDKNPAIKGLAFDSRSVSEGFLFFALPGTHTSGNVFIAQAIQKGAAAVVFQGEIDEKNAALIRDALAGRKKNSLLFSDRARENHENLSEENKAARDDFADSRSADEKSCADLSDETADFDSKTHVDFENPRVKNADSRSADDFSGVAFVKVKDSRFCMAPISSAFYGNPSEKLKVIGVTGTEGKSSAVSFIWQFLKDAGKKAGFISTVQYSFGEKATDNSEHQTTPEAPIIQERLFRMAQNGCEYAVIESSSHGLSKKTNRTGCVNFDCAIFLNVTLEHLEFHKTFEQYRSDKANLFRKLDEHDHVKTINGQKTKITPLAIVNVDDPSAEYFLRATKQRAIGFSSRGKEGAFKADFDSNRGDSSENISESEIPLFKAGAVKNGDQGIEFDLSFESAFDFPCRACENPKNTARSCEEKTVHVKSSVPGAFNSYNITAAIIAVSFFTGLPISRVAESALRLLPVKGRMTTIDKGQPFEVIVDYAHTPSSFEAIFPPIRERVSGKMIAVFGSGGERDTTKRPLQGEIAARFCDIVILTDEDPRKEDSLSILNQIAKGAEKQGMRRGENLFLTPDRPRAIRQAVKIARKGDVILLLGKAHENSIIYKDYVMPYDEIAEAEKALDESGYSKPNEPQPRAED